MSPSRSPAYHNTPSCSLRPGAASARMRRPHQRGRCRVRRAGGCRAAPDPGPRTTRRSRPGFADGPTGRAAGPVRAATHGRAAHVVRAGSSGVPRGGPAVRAPRSRGRRRRRARPAGPAAGSTHRCTRPIRCRIRSGPAGSGPSAAARPGASRGRPRPRSSTRAPGSPSPRRRGPVGRSPESPVPYSASEHHLVELVDGTRSVPVCSSRGCRVTVPPRRSGRVSGELLCGGTRLARGRRTERLVRGQRRWTATGRGTRGVRTPILCRVRRGRGIAPLCLRGPRRRPGCRNCRTGQPSSRG